MVLDDLVFLATDDWLKIALEHSNGFGFAIESKNLADSVSRCFDGAVDY
jgi:hypothetical protein